ncbi:avidin [Bombina bombina]|uniref:avidin n=1 Tax=Bombina bombina TaxID=8345 RepID=UPI00235AF27E|nr:avidin [Bombina bombina]
MKLPLTTVSIALVLLALMCCADTKCILSGNWTNDLGSNMTISAVDKDGVFTGIYLTSVSATNKTIVKSPLTGYQQLSDLPTFGFTVKWLFTDSVTSWTGQCFQNSKGQRILKTMWLLRFAVTDFQDNWKATSVGYNIFEPID